MQQILGKIRRAVYDYEMIQAGDKIAVGISGGKDSLILLSGLAKLRVFFDKPFDLVGITLDPGFNGQATDYSPVAAFAEELGVPYIIRRTNIGEIVFDQRQEKNPCSLCARMRRGALHDEAKANGCNKIALGHHQDDAIETFLMNLFQEGRIGCFSPSSYLSRKDLTMIRPLVYTPERLIRNTCTRLEYPVVKSVCPADKTTERQRMKDFIAEKERENPGFAKRIFGAMRRASVDGWTMSN